MLCDGMYSVMEIGGGGKCRFFFQAEDGIRDWSVTGVQTCALPILCWVVGVLGRGS